MIENVPPESPSGKELVLTRLREFRTWSEQRDPLVCDAKRAGATYAEIMAASGLAKGTVNSILTRAGLTGDHAIQEDAMLAAVLTTANYQHHPHFVRVDPAPDDEFGILCRYLKRVEVAGEPTPRVKFTFDTFTGDEPKPDMPDLTPLDRAAALRGEDRYESALCEAEWRVADDLWALARYTRHMLPLLENAAGAWTRYAAALEEMDRCYRDLRTTSQWKQGVLRLLDAHAEALDAAADWGQISRDIDEPYVLRRASFPDLHALAQQHGIAVRPSTWRLDKHAYSTIESKIREQKRQLAEVAELSGGADPA